ncbi:serine hydrolase domain-containing protein [Robiginitomaculum antarcticum]|uniref:serine hydrolase domain-containing protein n=1 Tax=Robiginitomaculum antarcticum TaxID=437507 RepID=UPI00037F4193|nr:serine hydrolase [Robiginitomaculum antarcticum]
MKRIIIGLLVVLLIIGIAAAVIKGPQVKRALAVKHLFDYDRIVANFSNMDKVFPVQRYAASENPHVWGKTPEDLPEFVTLGGEQVRLTDWLEETDTTAFLVIRGNDIVFEDYYKGTHADDRRISWSMSKSFVSAIFGTALERGEISSLDDKVTDYIPEMADSAYSDATLLNVLNMSSGVGFNEDYMDQDSDINRMGRAIAWGDSMDGFSRSLKVQDRAPGTARHYVSIDTHILGMVLRSATGETFHELFETRLWSKLGASHSGYYITDEGGVAFVLGGLNMTTRDYALFGALFRDGGKWNGEQVVPADWVAASTAKSAPSPDIADPFDYGYQWWVPENADGDFYANGIYGQTIYINPKANIVIVKNSADREFTEAGPRGMSPKHEGVLVSQQISEHYSR